MSNLGTTEIILILVVVFLFFGGAIIRTTAKKTGERVKDIKKAKEEFEKAVKEDSTS